ncbi:hypothetical protein ABFU49_00085 [Xanthomonas campestris pv. campestris]|uniref:hypothetical protein n=1 Tax=Xanthomonas campestris TaxID=339 RepID=UPI00388EAFF6
MRDLALQPVMHRRSCMLPLIAVRRREHQHHDQWHDIALDSPLRSATIIDAAQTPLA